MPKIFVSMRWLIFILAILFIQFFAYQAIRSAFSSRWINLFFVGLTLFFFLNFFGHLYLKEGGKALQGGTAYAFGFLLAWLLFQLILCLFVFSEDIVRFFIGIFSKRTYQEKSLYMPSRRSFVAKVALGIAAIPFASMLYGMYKGKYNFKVLKYELEFDDLPDEFDGYQITQISDIHCGSFDNFDKIAYGVDLIKEQNSDAVFFTGDLVNNIAGETDQWKKLFSTITAPDGVYAVLGNHDYGMYYSWEDESERLANLNELKQIERDMGWDLLLNEKRTIERNGKALHIVGVENWGNGHFPKYGDEDKAAEGLTDRDFKILLSHDPSHWEEKIQFDPRNYQLTLSGHTHGMQFGIEIPGWVKWSPIKYRYKYWAGLYQENGRYINVNRGFGYLAYPGRVGIWPEITVIKLKKRK